MFGVDLRGLFQPHWLCDSHLESYIDINHHSGWFFQCDKIQKKYVKLTIIAPLWPNKSHQAPPTPQQPFPTHEVDMCYWGKSHQQCGVVTDCSTQVWRWAAAAPDTCAGGWVRTAVQDWQGEPLGLLCRGRVADLTSWLPVWIRERGGGQTSLLSILCHWGQRN